VAVVGFEQGESFRSVIGVRAGEIDELLDVSDRHSRVAQAAEQRQPAQVEVGNCA